MLMNFFTGIKNVDEKFIWTKTCDFYL